MAGPRPGGVTLVAVLTWINGLFGIIGGVLALIASAVGEVPWIVGLVGLIIGVITIIVGVGLLRGNPTARVVATIVLVISLATAILGIFNGVQIWSVIGSGLTALIGLILLWTGRASEFFARP